jgi:hypothetical protein
VYSTCLFCHQPLGRNDAVEHFPVGRRLAFDSAKGRLWVVCRKCERWNLTPLEERWEAVEECERAFRATKLRVSTDHIGLARLKEGMDLVRIGEPQRPEMAAWRYGDQFGRRRRRRISLVAGTGAVLAGVIVAGPMLGLYGGISFQALWQTINAGNWLYKSRTLINIPSGNETRRLRMTQLHKVKLVESRGDLILRLSVLRNQEGSRWESLSPRSSESIELIGDDAVRAAGAILPRMNRGGGSAEVVQEAVGYLERAKDVDLLFRRAARTIEKTTPPSRLTGLRLNGLKHLHASSRLALEMAAHEDSERRALEGELHILEAAWKDAEEVAGIADDMFLPASVEDDLARLKRQRDGE